MVSAPIEVTKTVAAQAALFRAEPSKKPAAKSELATPQPVTGVPEKKQPAPAAVKAAAPKVNRVLLELDRPGAHQVCVAGSFNGWKPETTPLVPLGNGRWVGDLAVKPGRYEYLFVVDGQWVPDPKAKESVQNPFGGKNSVLIATE